MGLVTGCQCAIRAEARDSVPARRPVGANGHNGIADDGRLESPLRPGRREVRYELENGCPIDRQGTVDPRSEVLRGGAGGRHQGSPGPRPALGSVVGRLGGRALPSGARLEEPGRRPGDHRRGTRRGPRSGRQPAAGAPGRTPIQTTNTASGARARPSVDIDRRGQWPPSGANVHGLFADTSTAASGRSRRRA